jgi:hypothetical protein
MIMPIVQIVVPYEEYLFLKLVAFRTPMWGQNSFSFAIAHHQNLSQE